MATDPNKCLPVSGGQSLWRRHAGEIPGNYFTLQRVWLCFSLSSEIYDGLSAVYDYGQWGSELKKNIKDYWWKSMTQLHENIVGIDAAIFMHPTTWKASGHVDNFNDPMIDNKDSKKDTVLII